MHKKISTGIGMNKMLVPVRDKFIMKYLQNEIRIGLFR